MAHALFCVFTRNTLELRDLIACLCLPCCFFQAAQPVGRSMADEPRPDESGWRLNLFNVEGSPVRVSDNTAPCGRQATAGQA